ncbi:hypothetical protein EV421DRAFT_528643 [Armillaria borealis]|uniref:Uncharacterized protein n=1 Tax=Armillaria borealis TaxID=47425 RepID=A0AA39JNF2_9AGAR|nr:hypothetical protein EV421DRAFT_528643 [Armillaria borealis]
MYGVPPVCSFSRCTTMFDIDSCLKIARFTAAAGEMAPFPFIKSAAQCVVVVLEAIESATKNRKDLQELAESIVATLVVVRETVIDHGPTSASCFKDICLDFQTYLDDLLSKLNKESKSRGIRRFLKAKKISDDISAYKQRVQTAKEDFLIRTTTMTRLTLSDVHEEVTTGFSSLTGFVEASERNITSTIKDNIQEMRTLGVQQSENLPTRLSQASRQRGLYKGVVWDIIPGDIHIIKRTAHSLRRYRTNITYKDSYCTIENSNTPKIIREYQAHGHNGEDAMDLEQLDQSLDFFIKAKHPNLAQIFGVCRSSSLPAVIFHGTIRIPFDYYLHNLTAKRFVKFYSELFQDLQSVSEILTMASDRRYRRYKCYIVRLTANNPISTSMRNSYLETCYTILITSWGCSSCPIHWNMANIASAIVTMCVHRPSHFTMKSADGFRLQVHERGIY